MTESISLRSLDKGARAKIVEVTADGAMGVRMREMGLVSGVEIEVIGRAPLKDPVAIRLLGFTLTLRNNEANFIKVIPI